MKNKKNSVEAEKLSREIDGGIPYIEVGETKSGHIYFRSLETDDEELIIRMADAVVGAMMDNPVIGMTLMTAAITFIGEMGDEEDADRVAKILDERADKELAKRVLKNNNLKN